MIIFLLMLDVRCIYIVHDLIARLVYCDIQPPLALYTIRAYF